MVNAIAIRVACSRPRARRARPKTISVASYFSNEDDTKHSEKACRLHAERKRNSESIFDHEQSGTESNLYGHIYVSSYQENVLNSLSTACTNVFNDSVEI